MRRRDATEEVSDRDRIGERVNVLVSQSKNSAQLRFVDRRREPRRKLRGLAFEAPRAMATSLREMLGAVFNFLGELVVEEKSPEPAAKVVTNLRERLGQCVEEDEQGQQRLTVTLSNRESLDQLASTLAKLLSAGGDSGE